MLKILQVRLQKYVNWELSDVQAGLRKGRRTRDQIANDRQIIEKGREFQKNIYFIDYLKAFSCVDHNKLWKILKRTGVPDHHTCLLRKLYADQEATVRTEHGTDCFKTGKEWDKAVCCHPVYLTDKQSTSCEMLGWIKHSWIQDCWEKYQQPQLCRWYSNHRKWTGIKEPLEGERREWKSWLNTQHSKN